MRVTFTPKALDQARREIVALSDPSAGLLIFRGSSGVDVKRNASGGVVWTRRAVSGWQAWCLPLSEWPAELDRVIASGITVILVDAPGSPREFRINLRKGKLRATLDA